MRTLELLDADSSGPDVLASFVDEVMGLRTACVCLDCLAAIFYSEENKLSFYRLAVPLSHYWPELQKRTQLQSIRFNATGGLHCGLYRL